MDLSVDRRSALAGCFERSRGESTCFPARRCQRTASPGAEDATRSSALSEEGVLLRGGWRLCLRRARGGSGVRRGESARSPRRVTQAQSGWKVRLARGSTAALLFLASWALSFGQGIQSELIRLPASPKISPPLADRLQTSAPAERLKVWVFFTDKGLRSEIALAEALSVPERCLTQRAIQRRLKVRREGQVSGFEDLPVFEPYVRAVLGTGAQLRTRSRWFNAVTVWATPSQILRIAEMPFVALLRPVVGAKREKPPSEAIETRSEVLQPSVPKYRLDYGPSQAQLEQIQVPLLHELGYSGRGVLVAMFDTGFFKRHEAFSRLRIVAERDFVMGDGDTERNWDDPTDYSDSHGTYTWSALAGFCEGELIGPAYGADFLLAKTEDERSETPVEEDYWAAAVEWADSLGADVISSSLGYFDWYRFEDMDGNTAVCTRAADWAAKQGIAVVVAAGNWNNTPWGHISAPADGDSVIAVGAVDANGVIASWSSRGPTFDGRIKPEVCARGVGTRCATRRSPSSFGSASGTSLSTPLIGGACALLLEVHPEWTGWDARQALISTASQAHRPDNTYGWGIARVFEASGLRAPIPLVTSLEVLEPAATANGVLDPGEEFGFRIGLRNEGNEPTQGGVLRFRTSLPWVIPLDTCISFPGVEASQEIAVTASHVFRLQGLPEGATAVPVQLVIETHEGRSFTRSFFCRLAGAHWVRGSVQELATSLPVPGATVSFRPRLAPSDSVIWTRTNSSGEYRCLLPAGEYVAQATAAGYFPSLAAPFSLPEWETGRIYLALGKPVLEARVLVVEELPGEPDSQQATVEVRNAGAGDLFVAALPGAVVRPLPGERPAPFRIELWRDLREHSLADVKSISAELDGEGIRYTVSHWSPLPDTLEWQWAFFLDSDQDTATGERVGGLGADLRILADLTSGSLEVWQANAWRPILSLAGVSFDGCDLSVAVPESLFSPLDTNAVVPFCLSVQAKWHGSFRVFDHAPDPGPWRAFLPTRHPGGIRLSEGSLVLWSGQTSQLRLEFRKSGSPGQEISLLLASWDPLKPVQLLLIPQPAHVSQSRSAESVPRGWQLDEVHPNPVVDRTVFSVQGPPGSEFALVLVDARGREVSRFTGRLPVSGASHFHWDGRDVSGRFLPNGVYVARLQVGDQVHAARKLLLLR